MIILEHLGVKFLFKKTFRNKEWSFVDTLIHYFTVYQCFVSSLFTNHIVPIFFKTLLRVIWLISLDLILGTQIFDDCNSDSDGGGD